MQALLLACGSAFATGPLAASADCFSMYDTKNALVYQSSETPIDLSHSVSQQMALHYPSRALVISTTTSCSEPQGGGASRFIGADESGALYGSASSPASPSMADAESDAKPRVVRRAARR